MSMEDNEPGLDGLGPWAPWVLGSVQVGLLVLDAQQRIVYANPWLLRRARLKGAEVQNCSVFEVFPELQGGHFQRALAQAARTGFPAVLSETLHEAPLPLYALANGRGLAQRLQQAVHIVPMGAAAARQAGQRYVLIQVSDVTPAAARTRLLKEQAERMHAMAHVDALTDIGNRRHFDAMLEREWRQAVREQEPLSLVLFDIDHFKQYNDSYGHQRGDACLKQVAGIIESMAQRPRDVVCRYGGEEMAMLLPDTDIDGAVALAREVVQRVQGDALPHADSPLGVVTISAGVAAQRPQSGMQSEALLLQADRALYQAKHMGRNRVGVLPAPGGAALFESLSS